MDTLYVGNIPLEYRYATFSGNYITLYNTSTGHNNTLHYYRVYTTNNGFFYSEGDQTFGQNYQYFQAINTSNNWMYRNDIDKIFIVCLCVFIMFLFVFNIITSCFKKGGVFGGLF